jgi:hypothetical protein
MLKESFYKDDKKCGHEEQKNREHHEQKTTTSFLTGALREPDCYICLGRIATVPSRREHVRGNNDDVEWERTKWFVSNDSDRSKCEVMDTGEAGHT